MEEKDFSLHGTDSFEYNIGDEVYYNTSDSSFSIKLCKIVAIELCIGANEDITFYCTLSDGQIVNARELLYASNGWSEAVKFFDF